MTLILQSPATPGVALDAIAEGATPEATELAYAVAYVTLGGSRLLADRLRTAVSTKARTLVTCFDFGSTEPAALRFLQGEGFDVRIANLGAKGQPQINPSALSYHPKLYIAARGGDEASIVTGSANLSRRALTVNFEAVSLIADTTGSWRSVWARLVNASAPLSAALLSDYEQLRSTVPRPLPDEPPVPEPIPGAADVDTLDDAVRGGLDASEFGGFWIEVGYASGGSENQVELPRSACQFFGFDFHDYTDDQITIGTPRIRIGAHQSERVLSWHGDNRMERINVPTVHQGGEPVKYRVVLFERALDHFVMRVVDPDSPDHHQWRDESAAAGTLFRLGRTSATLRQCGLI